MCCSLLTQKRISFEPTTTYLLKDLKPFTTYTFRLAARSKHGVGAYTNEISAETPQTRRSSSLSYPALTQLWTLVFKCITEFVRVAPPEQLKNGRKLLGINKTNVFFFNLMVNAFENRADWKTELAYSCCRGYQTMQCSLWEGCMDSKRLSCEVSRQGYVMY